MIIQNLSAARPCVPRTSSLEFEPYLCPNVYEVRIPSNRVSLCSEVNIKSDSDTVINCVNNGEQRSGQTKHRFRRVPLMIRMPVTINQNFDVAAGIVNGSYGVLRRIRYLTDDGQRHLKSCTVEITSSDAVEIPDLPKHHFPTLPDSMEVKLEYGGSHRRCTIMQK